MKIIGISVSSKGNASNTLELVNSVLKGAESEGAKTELIDLYKLNLEYCTDAESFMLQVNVLYLMILWRYLEKL